MPKTLSTIVLLVTVSFLAAGTFLYPEEESIADKAARIHDAVLTVDTHVDTPMRLGHPEFDLGTRYDPRNRGGKVDLPRMSEGGLDAIFFAVFLGQGARTPEGNAKARERTLGMFDEIHKAIVAIERRGLISYARLNK